MDFQILLTVAIVYVIVDSLGHSVKVTLMIAYNIIVKMVFVLTVLMAIHVNVPEDTLENIVNLISMTVILILVKMAVHASME